VSGITSYTYGEGSTGLVHDVAFVTSQPNPDPLLSLSAQSADSQSIDVHVLVSSYLDALTHVTVGSVDGLSDGSHGTGELAYHLDAQISTFIDNHGLTNADYAAIHQDVMDHIAHDLNEVIPGSDHDIAFNDQGHVTDDASVLAAMDQHLQDLIDHHNSLDDFIYHDVVTTDHTTV